MGYGIFTEADDWEHLKHMLRDAVSCHFDDGEAPSMIRIHLVHYVDMLTHRLGESHAVEVVCLSKGKPYR